MADGDSVSAARAKGNRTAYEYIICCWQADRAEGRQRFEKFRGYLGNRGQYYEDANAAQPTFLLTGQPG